MADEEELTQTWSQEEASFPTTGKQELGSLLRAEHACLIGTLDRDGRQLIIVPHYKGEARELSDSLSYLSQLFSEDILKKGFTIIIDARSEKWIYFKSILQVIQETLVNQVAAVLILKPDAFWERRKSGRFSKHDLNTYPFEIVLLSSLSKLEQYVEKSQLPETFGGTYQYDAQPWIQRRTDIENFLRSVPHIAEELDELNNDLERDLQDNATTTSLEDIEKEQRESEAKFHKVATELEKGVKLLEEIRKDSEESSSELQDVCRLDDMLAGLYSDYDQLAAMWDKKNENLYLNVSLGSFEQDSKQVSEELMRNKKQSLFVLKK